jgi:hypothetical protein
MPSTFYLADLTRPFAGHPAGHRVRFTIEPNGAVYVLLTPCLGRILDAAAARETLRTVRDERGRPVRAPRYTAAERREANARRLRDEAVAAAERRAAERAEPREAVERPRLDYDPWNDWGMTEARMGRW